MKSPYDIIKKPIITENSMTELQKKKYTFEVAPDANKIEIKKAVEEIFKVDVKDVNTVKRPAKEKRMGAHIGMTTETKKAVVTLTEKSKTIEFFEGMI